MLNEINFRMRVPARRTFHHLEDGTLFRRFKVLQRYASDVRVHWSVHFQAQSAASSGLSVRRYMECQTRPPVCARLITFIYVILFVTFIIIVKYIFLFCYYQYTMTTCKFREVFFHVSVWFIFIRKNVKISRFHYSSMWFLCLIL